MRRLLFNLALSSFIFILLILCSPAATKAKMDALYKQGVQANGDNTVEMLRKRQARELLKSNLDSDKIKEQLLKAKELQAMSGTSGRQYKGSSTTVSAGPFRF